MEIIPANLAITAMRDSGYKNTAYAVAELIDNSQQAGASNIEVLCVEEEQLIEQRRRSRVSQIAVFDDGKGMDEKTLRNALQFGNGSYLNDRTGIGRFGMGLPNASISQARRVEVWSWQNGLDNAVHTYLDVDEIKDGQLTLIPEPRHDPVPNVWRERVNFLGKSGSLILWSKLDPRRLTWKTAKSILEHTAKISGRIYRRFINEHSLIIRVAAIQNQQVVYDSEIEAIDPMYLTPMNSLPDPFNSIPMFMDPFDGPMRLNIKVGDTEHEVLLRFSVATSETVARSGIQDRGGTPYGKHAKNNIGVSVMRAGRELLLDSAWCSEHNPRERWWGAEVEFPPELDEIFGVTNNKQAATHFSELATMEWELLAEEGEEFEDFVERLNQEGDPRGALLILGDTLKRQLSNLRGILKGQGANRRNTRRHRHNDPDDLTGHVNKKWKERSTEKPISGEEEPLSSNTAEEIKKDLQEKQQYTPEDAEDLINLIRTGNLKIVFLEQDFPDSRNLFDVKVMGNNLTEVIFNRRHPAFNDIFGTVNTVDEDIESLTLEEIKNRLMQAINSSKIMFAAWARYEREAGAKLSERLENVRHDWGRIAAEFLDPEE